MKLIENIDETNKHLVINVIKKFGDQPEHHYPHFKYLEEKDSKCMFFYFPKNEEGFMVHKHKTGLWEFLVEPLAPKERRLQIATKALNYVLNLPDTYKALIEFTPELRKELIKYNQENGNNWIIRRPCYVYYWPIYDLQEWDPNLSGKKWKKMRNILNAFKRDKDVKVVDSKDVDKEELKRIFKDWTKERRDNDRIEDTHYLNTIENSFQGYDYARTVVVDGIPRTITAGWQVGNTGYCYSSLGITDYSLDGLGEFSNIDDLNNLKKMGMKHADFGGSDKLLLTFKNKFKPTKIYKTYLFYIVKNNNGSSSENGEDVRVKVK